MTVLEEAIRIADETKMQINGNQNIAEKKDTSTEENGRRDACMENGTESIRMNAVAESIRELKFNQLLLNILMPIIWRIYRFRRWQVQ